MPALSVLLLLEKKAGHIHQVEGVGRIVAEIAPAQVTKLHVRPAWWADRAVKGFILQAFALRDRAALSRAIRALYRIDPATLARPDIIVASGRPVTALALMLKRYFGSKIVFSGNPSGPRIEEIDMALLSNPRRKGQAGPDALVPVPGIIEAGEFPVPKVIRTTDDLRGATLTLMIGGDSHSHKFKERDWRNLETLLTETRERYGVRWRVSTSRRSPPLLAPVFDALAAKAVIEEFVDFQKGGLGSGNRMFGAADIVVVTEDSLSMISEGFASGRPVIALRPRKVTTHHMLETVAYQVGQGWLTSLLMANLTADVLANEICKLRMPAWTARDAIEAAIRPVVMATVAAKSNA